MSKSEDILQIRSKLGCGLREAKDAIEKYGSFEAAWAALKPDAPLEGKDPYARAVEDRERWHSKSSAYRNTLIRILNITTDTHADIRRIVEDGLMSGDNI